MESWINWGLKNSELVKKGWGFFKIRLIFIINVPKNPLIRGKFKIFFNLNGLAFMSSLTRPGWLLGEKVPKFWVFNPPGAHPPFFLLKVPSFSLFFLSRGWARKRGKGFFERVFRHQANKKPLSFWVRAPLWLP